MREEQETILTYISGRILSVSRTVLKTHRG